MLVMAIRIKNKKLNILWPISILKFTLVFMSFTFFSQSFLSLLTVFQCKEGHSFISENLKCRAGIWFYIMGSVIGISLIFQIVIALITASLFFKPVFINTGSDLHKKSSSLQDIVLVLTKIGVNLIFALDKGKESEHWTAIFFLILFTGTNAYYNLALQNRSNHILSLLNDIFSLITVSGYVTLLIGKMFKILEFSGALYLFLVFIIIIIIYIIFYKNKEIDYISIDYTEIKNPVDYLYYISNYYKIIRNKNNSRNYYTVLESLISKIEENCIIQDCPLRKYLENMNFGIECPFLLNQYCEKLFEYGISKYADDISLKNNYSIFLIVDMNYKKKALMILNTIKKKALSFKNNYDVYRTIRLIEKYNSSLFNKNNSTFEYRKNIQEFKVLIKKITVLYFDFLSLLLGSKLQNIDNFDKIHKIGREIMKLNPKIEEIYNNLTIVKTDNLEIIKIYSEFVEGVLKDDEKLEKCQNMAKLTYSSDAEIHEKDFSNFDIEILNEKFNLPYLIVSAHKEHIGKIIDSSLNVSKIFGYVKNEIIGQNINFLLPKIFHKKHDLVIVEEYEKNKLKLFDVLSKKRIYFPDFIKKDIFGISKMKFLIELKLNIYLVKTEENKLLYIVEILNYYPILLDLIKNENNISKFCVLTDENFLIQTFTSNCVANLKLNSDYINSNFSIINYIKQFQDDYLTAINNSGITKYSHINTGEINLEEKTSEQKNLKNSISPFIKKRIKNELIYKKYSKKCQITWRNVDNSKSFPKKKYLNLNKSNIFGTQKPDTEINLFMEIRKIIIKNELLGYYFFFTQKPSRNYHNINYIIEKNETNDNNNNLIQIKKYQCHFKSEDYNYYKDKYKHLITDNHNQMYSSLIVKPNIIDFKANDMSKSERKKSLDKTKVSFGDNDLVNNYSISVNYNTTQDNSDYVNGDFIPTSSCHFTIDLKNLCFIKKNETNEPSNYLEILKKEAENKKEKYVEQLKLISKDDETSSDGSEDNESDDFSDNNSNFNIYSSITNSDDNKREDIIKNENKKEEDEENKEKEPAIIGKKKTKKNFQENPAENISLNSSLHENSSKKLMNKNNLSNEIYRVNLSNIQLLIYDFYKDMIVDGSKNDLVSKVETIMNNIRNQGPLDFEKDERFSLLSLFHPKNKSKKSVKDNKDNKDNKDSKSNEASDFKNDLEKNKKIINEEKLYEKKISEALKKQRDEPPIKKLKIFVFAFYFIILIYILLTMLLDTSYMNLINQTLDITKKLISVKYCCYISVYYLRELTLINFNADNIEGGVYQKYMANTREEISNFITKEIMDLFIENQSSMKIIYSTSLTLSNNSQKYLTKTKLNIKMTKDSKVELKNVILVSLMQYNGAFNNLATSTIPIAQDHPDLFSFIYNCLNGYKHGINDLIRLYNLQFDYYLIKIKRIVIISSIITILIIILIDVIIMMNYIAATKRRGNYMKVFYGINENILKILIFNCENLMNKLKSSEEQRFHEEETVYESMEDKLSFENNQKLTQKQKILISQNTNLSSSDDNKINNKVSSYGIIFILIFIICSLICYIFFIYNGIYMINSSKASIKISKFFNTFQNFQLGILDTFNAYREFLFDNQSIINGTSPNNYLTEIENNSLELNIANIQYLSTVGEEILKEYTGFTNLTEENNLCELYQNDYFDSSSICSQTIGLITSYDFYTLSYYFLEELKIYKNVAEYRLENEDIVGNLTEYDLNSYLNDPNIPKTWNKTSTTFRLSLFNDETLHNQLNMMFANIILPFIQKSRKNVFDKISFNYITGYLIILNFCFFIIITLAFFAYFIPMIRFINNIIYKTKNMLSIIPLSILASQSGVSTLLNLSKKNK